MRATFNWPIFSPGWALILGCCLALNGTAADLIHAPQHFAQEVAVQFSGRDGLPSGAVQLVDAIAGEARAFVGGHWYEFSGEHWVRGEMPDFGDGEFGFMDAKRARATLNVPWREVRQLIHRDSLSFVATDSGILKVEKQKIDRVAWPANRKINQIALDTNGLLYIASSAGLFMSDGPGWEQLEVADEGGRNWAVRDVLGVGFDSKGELWFATKAGVGCRHEKSWSFYEGKDGLPWNDFTGLSGGPDGEVWFATHLGVIRLDSAGWQYRQGPLWLPKDDVRQITIDGKGRAWVATAGGLGCIERKPMTLAQKADWYETEIDRYIRRTPFGFVAEAWLRKPGDKSSADPQDTDNDGLWTAMYGAGECFAYGATKQPQFKVRARQAFEALRFLQKVTQNCQHSPPPGYVARTVRPSDWPDPNIGRLASDLQAQQTDKLWKAYEPRWPKSADAKWFWKSDTSSDELDGHFFFYPLYYDFCADSEPERERVREVVRALMDHLLAHDFCLVDYDGKPTRWGVYGPHFLNDDPNWWSERGLKSLSILSYLAVACHITGDAKYEEISRQLITRHGYAHNAMYPKVQSGPGSGNQSDDEMAFMDYYGLLRCSRDESLKALIRYSFLRYWVNEAPEMNPFFNFAFAAQNLQAQVISVWGPVSVKPWGGWLDDSMATLYGFPLDRVSWPHRNSHRLDIIPLSRVNAVDSDESEQPGPRGYRRNGKVLPVENRHFNHWNTDPWELDYRENGNELGAGTVFLLPYYMGLYHGFIEKPER